MGARGRGWPQLSSTAHLTDVTGWCYWVGWVLPVGWRLGWQRPLLWLRLHLQPAPPSLHSEIPRRVPSLCRPRKHGFSHLPHGRSATHSAWSRSPQPPHLSPAMQWRMPRCPATGQGSARLPGCLWGAGWRWGLRTGVCPSPLPSRAHTAHGGQAEIECYGEPCQDQGRGPRLPLLPEPGPCWATQLPAPSSHHCFYPNPPATFWGEALKKPVYFLKTKALGF